jgi:hypothetical protein
MRVDSKYPQSSHDWVKIVTSDKSKHENNHCSQGSDEVIYFLAAE